MHSKLTVSLLRLGLCAHVCSYVCGCFVLGVCFALNDFLLELVVKAPEPNHSPLAPLPSLRLLLLPLLLRPLQPGRNSI